MFTKLSLSNIAMATSLVFFTPLVQADNIDSALSNADQEIANNPSKSSSTQVSQQRSLAAAKALYSDGEFKQAIRLLESIDSSAEVFGEMIINYAQFDLDEAEDLAEDAISAYPDNARLFYLRGVVMGSQAQDSIFSALGYAEKALNSFIKANELAPNDIQYKRALMSFYMAAPSIAGGDTELGKHQLSEIKKLDALEGAIAEVSFYQMSDDIEQAKKVLAQAMQSYPKEISFPFQLGAIEAQSENYEQAMSLFKQAANMRLPPYSTDEETGDINKDYRRNAAAHLNALYQVGRTAVVSESNAKEGIAAMGRLAAAIETSKLPPSDLPNMQWAAARLAELYIQVGDKQAAKSELASIVIGDDDKLEKQVKKLKKALP
ncbi:hypothetical protein ISG33_00125 [Glaciecola sp. MH2013]|uniref:tetratricopeptide repeat protein n=1 Tax=Glaciecola sp. MH2013 TaxID=2785524 RepID=UPI0018A01A6C|nr:hypothetical protein [Glaciecola sp. MH2013]MBF7071802.1 hypothetical protein [Glaciecola sp. MH2013]